jgi:hypothetical protein
VTTDPHRDAYQRAMTGLRVIARTDEPIDRAYTARRFLRSAEALANTPTDTIRIPRWAAARLAQRDATTEPEIIEALRAALAANPTPETPA